MTTFFILLSITLVLFIVGIIVCKIGSNKSRFGLMVTGAFILVASFICCFFTYEKYNLTPVVYSIVAHREKEDSYQLTLSSPFKGLTGGTVYISEAEALTMGLIEEDDEGKIKWIGGSIKQNREWVNNHRG